MEGERKEILKLRQAEDMVQARYAVQARYVVQAGNMV